MFWVALVRRKFALNSFKQNWISIRGVSYISKTNSKIQFGRVIRKVRYLFWRQERSGIKNYKWSKINMKGNNEEWCAYSREKIRPPKSNFEELITFRKMHFTFCQASDIFLKYSLSLLNSNSNRWVQPLWSTWLQTMMQIDMFSIYKWLCQVDLNM